MGVGLCLASDFNPIEIEIVFPFSLAFLLHFRCQKAWFSCVFWGSSDIHSSGGVSCQGSLARRSNQLCFPFVPPSFQHNISFFWHDTNAESIIALSPSPFWLHVWPTTFGWRVHRVFKWCSKDKICMSQNKGPSANVTDSAGVVRQVACPTGCFQAASKQLRLKTCSVVPDGVIARAKNNNKKWSASCLWWSQQSRRTNKNKEATVLRQPSLIPEVQWNLENNEAKK